MASGEAIDEEELPGEVLSTTDSAAASVVALARFSGALRLTGIDEGVLQIPIGARIADMERQMIMATFACCGKNKERTSAMLGISMRTLHSRLKDYQACG